MTRPFLSLVIATINRDLPLERCLKSLLHDGGDDFEIVVVDQNRDDRVHQVVARFKDRLPIVHVRRHFEGASAARNAGTDVAVGAWVGFPDDDASFRPDSLRQLRRYTQMGAYDLITGMTRDEAGKPSVLPWSKHQCDLTTHLLRRTVAESTLFVRRELFLECKGFDPLFGPGGAFYAEEAIDLVRRIRRDQPATRMRFIPEVCLVHAHSIAYQDYESLRKARCYACGRGACFARHWRHASKWRVLSEVSRHAIGSVVFSGLRRKSRVDCLFGYVEGYRAYRRLERESTGVTSSRSRLLPSRVPSRGH